MFVPETANEHKVQALRLLGAEVHRHGRDFDAAREGAVEFAREGTHALLEDGRDEDIAIGLGTVGIEIAQHPGGVDIVFVPIGNGALVSGVGAWLRRAMPACRVVGVCAEGTPSMQLSWKQGEIVRTDDVDTIADAGEPSRLTSGHILPLTRASQWQNSSVPCHCS